MLLSISSVVQRRCLLPMCCRYQEFRCMFENMNTQPVKIEVAPETAALLQAKAEEMGMTLDELLRSTFETPAEAAEKRPFYETATPEEPEVALRTGPPILFDIGRNSAPAIELFRTIIEWDLPERGFGNRLISFSAIHFPFEH